MALQLVEGQDFAGDYSLLSQLYRRDRGENWLALDAQSGERVVLKVFDGTLPEPTRNQISGAITATRGLVHPNIARVYRLGEYDGNDYIACQYVRHGTPFDPVVSTGEDLQERWPWIEQLLDAVSFAHGLGLAHGHLHPGNILVDEQGRLAITDFGLPASVQHEDEHHAYLSPQVIEAATPDPSDDIYSLGQLLIVILTGRTWRNDEGVFEPTRPIPTEIRELVRRMLSDNAYDRPHDLATIRDVLKRFMLGESDAPLEPAGEFRRREPPRTQAAAPETQRLPHERRGMSATTAIAGLALLILLAAGLFLVLPKCRRRRLIIR
ncbi:MAG: protein kinase [Gammaproteobacteria bacterium]|nr:protein kinase [Gammaproteobacteria bacterium]